jgi:hypothetical protein
VCVCVCVCVCVGARVCAHPFKYLCQLTDFHETTIFWPLVVTPAPIANNNNMMNVRNFEVGVILATRSWKAALQWVLQKYEVLGYVLALRRRKQKTDERIDTLSSGSFKFETYNSDLRHRWERMKCFRSTNLNMAPAPNVHGISDERNRTYGSNSS